MKTQMFKRILLLIALPCLFLNTSLANSLAAFGNEGGGGLNLAAEFKEIGRVFVEHARSRNVSVLTETLTADQFESALDSAKINPVSERPKIKGRSVDAKNNASTQEIEVFEQGWKEMDYWQKRRLVIHEVLGVSGLVSDAVHYRHTFEILKTFGFVYGTPNDRFYFDQMTLSCRGSKSRHDHYSLEATMTNEKIEFLLTDRTDPLFFGHSNYVAELAKTVGFEHPDIQASGEFRLVSVQIQFPPQSKLSPNSEILRSNCDIRTSATGFMPVFVCANQRPDQTQHTLFLFKDFSGREFRHSRRHFQISGNRTLKDRHTSFGTTHFPLDSYDITFNRFPGVSVSFGKSCEF